MSYRSRGITESHPGMGGVHWSWNSAAFGMACRSCRPVFLPESLGSCEWPQQRLSLGKGGLRASQFPELPRTYERLPESNLVSC